MSATNFVTPASVVSAALLAAFAFAGKAVAAEALTPTRNDDARWDDAYTAAARAARSASLAGDQGDLDAMLGGWQTAVAARDDHSTYLYNLACAQSRHGDDAGALATLRRLAALGVYMPAATDEDFASLRGNKTFVQVVALLDANLRPRGTTEKAFSLHAGPGIVEGIASRATTGEVFFSELSARRVLVRAPDGTTRTFASAGADSRLFTFGGIAVDEPHGLLWASSPALPEMAGYDEAQAGHSCLAAFSLADGSLQRVVSLPPDTAAHTVADITVAPDGTVYAPDSAAPVIWRVRPDDDTAGALTVIHAPGPRHSLQGAVVLGSRWLLVSDYSTGLHLVSLASGETHFVPVPPETCLLGIDGIAAHGTTVVAVQNGVRPARLLSLTFSPAEGGEGRPTLLALRVIAAAQPALADPTLVTVERDRFLVVGDAGWRFTGHNAPTAPATRDIPIVALPATP